MGNYRQDDLMALVQRAEARCGAAAKQKPVQRWTGGTAVEVADLNDAERLASALRESLKKSKSWETFEDSDVKHGPGWVFFWGSYTVRGANADDAEKFVKRTAAKLGVEILQDGPDSPLAAVYTHAVTPD